MPNLKSISFIVTLAVSTAFAEESPVPRAIPVSDYETVRAITEDYYAKDSRLRAADLRDVPMSSADLVVHLFQLGPNGESLFPYARIRTGNQCQNEEQLEFAVRWKRDADGALRVDGVNLLVGPSYELKSRKTSDGKTVYNLPEPILGSLSPYQLEIGKYSLAFTAPQYKERIKAGLIKVESVYNPAEPKSRQILTFKISTRVAKELPFTEKIARIDTEADATLRVRDPLTGEDYSATLMPYAIHFAPKSVPLLETQQKWGLLAPTGTALHGADWEHIQPRGDSNIGSAGCARLQSSFARGTFEAIQELLVKHGATMDASGQIEIYESDSLDPATGALKGQKIVESDKNYRNLKAMLEVRQAVAIKGFMKATLNSLYWSASKKVDEGLSALTREYYEVRGKISQSESAYRQAKARLAWIDKELRRLDGKISGGFSLFRLKTEASIRQWQSERAQWVAERTKLNQYLQRLGSDFELFVAQSPLLENLVASARDRAMAVELVKNAVMTNGQESLPKSVQMIYIYAKHAEELAAQIRRLKNPEEQNAPLYSMNAEEHAYYLDPQNQALIAKYLSRSLSEYYLGKYNGIIPPGCRQNVATYGGR